MDGQSRTDRRRRGWIIFSRVSSDEGIAYAALTSPNDNSEVDVDLDVSIDVDI
jgi:hypothetical protein